MDRDHRAGSTTLTIPLEDEQAEPFSDYYNYGPRTMVVLDGAWRIPAQLTHGILIVGLSRGSHGRPEPELRGSVLGLLDPEGTSIFEADQRLAKLFPARFRAPWVRLESPIVAETAAPIYGGLREALRRVDPGAGEPESVPVQGGVIRLRAGLFEEEHRPRSSGTTRFGDGWVFAVSFERNAPIPDLRPGKRCSRPVGKKGRLPAFYFLARPGRAGPIDMASRIPELHPLAGKCVAVFGQGCLGAPSALDLARGGLGKLRLLDHDFCDPAASVRWPLGIAVAGLYKPEVLAKFIEEHYPYTQVCTEVMRIGAVQYLSPDDMARGKVPADEAAALDRVLEGVDLIYEATAEEGIQYFLATEARRRGIPYISVHGTQGGWGGVVVRFRPGKTQGCWICYRLQCMAEIAPAPALDTGRVQPTGCGNPTFTGANFDLGEVALMGVRMAVATLSESTVGSEAPAYPPADWDVAVLALRDPSGALTPPTWRTYMIPRHPDCPVCDGRR